MTGKSSLLLIMGFAIIFMVKSKNFGDISNRSTDNFVNYYVETVAHDIAISAANIAANHVFIDPTWDAGYSNVAFQGGEYDVQVAVLDPYKNIREVTAQGTFHGITKEVKVKFAPSKFSKFAYFSVSEGGSIWWTGNDTVWGPFHTQDYMRVYRHPVYYGKATTKKKLIYYDSKSKDKPYFFGGYEQGVDLPLPTNAVDEMEAIADDDGLKFHGKDTVYLTFDGDSLKFRFNFSDPDSAIYLPSASPNGMIFAKDCIVRMKGTVKGQYTLGCSSIMKPGNGTIYLDDDIVFNQDPRQYPNSSDLLGICAENSVYMTENAANNSSINIHASIYCEKGGFGAENYKDRPPSGNINLLGGIIQHTRKAVGTFGGGGIKSGYAKRYLYDERLLVASPPFFPGTGGFEIVSWLEL